MSIDWLTVIAQIINFLVLIWLLKKFLYRPILNGIATREAKIAKLIDDAEQAKESAHKAEAAFKVAKSQHLNEQEDLLTQAMAQVQTEREEILKQAHQQIIHEQAQAKHLLHKEKLEFLKQLKQNALEDLLQVSKKMLTDLADEQLESAIARQLVKRMEKMMPELNQSVFPYREGEIRSRLPLTPDSQKRLLVELQNILPHIRFSFINSDQQDFGLSLHMGGVEVVWTLTSYLNELIKRYQEQHSLT